jgi:hypothetical protein
VARGLQENITKRKRRSQGEEMKARQRIDGASYEPDGLKAIGQAFDQAWQTIAGNYGDDPRDIEKSA